MRADIGRHRGGVICFRAALRIAPRLADDGSARTAIARTASVARIFIDVDHQNGPNGRTGRTPADPVAPHRPRRDTDTARNTDPSHNRHSCGSLYRHIDKRGVARFFGAALDALTLCDCARRCRELQREKKAAATMANAGMIFFIRCLHVSPEPTSIAGAASSPRRSDDFRSHTRRGNRAWHWGPDTNRCRDADIPRTAAADNGRRAPADAHIASAPRGPDSARSRACLRPRMTA